MPHPLKTSDIARIVGVHSNTVRLYEEKGFLSPVLRSKSGYRAFTPLHLEQMRLAHLALQAPYVGGYQVVVQLMTCVGDSDLGMAMEWAYVYLAQVRIEQTRAEAAIEFLERWARGQVRETTKRAMTIGEVAAHLNVTIDQLHNWDRNGLLDVPRDPATGYRLYSSLEIGRLRVIRMLRQSGYSLMSILRMLHQFDTGQIDHLRQALDTPTENEGLETAADRWLTTLRQQEQRAQAVIQQITVLMTMALS
jgi:DNA-binding transcriptional MerR regulator